MTRSNSTLGRADNARHRSIRGAGARPRGISGADPAGFPASRPTGPSRHLDWVRWWGGGAGCDPGVSGSGGTSRFGVEGSDHSRIPGSRSGRRSPDHGATHPRWPSVVPFHVRFAGVLVLFWIRFCMDPRRLPWVWWPRSRDAARRPAGPHPPVRFLPRAGPAATRRALSDLRRDGHGALNVARASPWPVMGATMTR